MSEKSFRCLNRSKGEYRLVNAIPPRMENSIIKIARKAKSKAESLALLKRYFDDRGWFIHEYDDQEDFDLVAQDARGPWAIITIQKGEPIPSIPVSLMRTFNNAVTKFIARMNIKSINSLFLTDIGVSVDAETYLRQKAHPSVHVRSIAAYFAPVKRETTRSIAEMPETADVRASFTGIETETPQSASEKAKTADVRASFTSVSLQMQLQSSIPAFFAKQGIKVSRFEIIELATKEPRLAQREILVKILGRDPCNSEKISMSRLFDEFMREKWIQMECHGKHKHYAANRAFFDWGVWFDEPPKKYDAVASTHFKPIYFAPIEFCRSMYNEYRKELEPIAPRNSKTRNIDRRDFPDAKHPGDGFLKAFGKEHLGVDDLVLHFFPNGIMIWPQTANYDSTTDRETKRDFIVKTLREYVEKVTGLLFQTVDGFKKPRTKPSPPPHVTISKDIIPAGTTIVNSDGQPSTYQEDKSPEAPTGQVEATGIGAEKGIGEILDINKRISGNEGAIYELKKDANELKQGIKELQHDLMKSDAVSIDEFNLRMDAHDGRLSRIEQKLDRIEPTLSRFVDALERLVPI